MEEKEFPRLGLLTSETPKLPRITLARRRDNDGFDLRRLRERMCRVRATAALRSFCKFRDCYHHGGETLTGHSEFTRNLTTTTTTTTTRGSGYIHPVRRSSKHPMIIQIIEALKLGDRRKASDLLLDIDQRSHSLRADDFYPIFKRCAQSRDPLFVMETWRLMEDKNISLNDKCILLMTETLCNGGYLEESKTDARVALDCLHPLRRAASRTDHQNYLES
ncbi:hypothetical protein PIB30_003234 [Stylosanthes scabra]|uniref:Pentatricopeptide repeat-containing protein n=1 Tax=Stylosanthes scabra TaxID=79078 RepID=A0ABU6R276_9FABA|nr:hypothetical protein [Stylosanthes scabra]